MRHSRIAMLIMAGLFLAGFCHYSNASAARTLTQSSDSGKQVVIYTGPNFTGRRQVLYDNWPGGGYFDRRVRSVRVPPGTKVWLYTETNYHGTQTVLTEDLSPSPGVWWIGRVRSIRVEREATPLPAPIPRPPVTTSYPVIYAQSGSCYRQLIFAQG